MTMQDYDVAQSLLSDLRTTATNERIAAETIRTSTLRSSGGSGSVQPHHTGARQLFGWLRVRVALVSSR
jgi:hypothetical protein